MSNHLPHNNQTVASLGAQGVVEVWDVRHLKPNPLNPRGPVSPDDPKVLELAASIRKKGVIEPPVILRSGMIVAGHRRAAGCLLAEVERTRVIVRDDLTEQEQLELMLIENVQREDLDPLQEGLAYMRLADLFKLTNMDIARRLGTNQMRVAERLAIARFPRDIALLFARGEMALSVAQHLRRIENEDDLRRIVTMAVSRRLTIKAIKRVVDQHLLPAKEGLRNYSRKQTHVAERPKGVVRDTLVESLTARKEESLKVVDLIRELDYVCCACGMADSPQSRATLCSACPLAAFLNRFAAIKTDFAHTYDLMAKTAPEGSR